jgi:diguanylate cyclase (GGDEF)-like protein
MSARSFSDFNGLDAAEATAPRLIQALVVDDSAADRQPIADHLRSWNFAVTEAQTGAEAWRILTQPHAPKLVLLASVLPDIGGIELCRRIRLAGVARPYNYVILLASDYDRQNMLEAMQAGADDYLVKPVDELKLKARLLAGRRILELQEHLVSARESMRHAATHDSLTELMNRGEILAMLQRELERARREHTPVGVILGDIDHFKTVNDTLGHLFGDEALREVGRRLRTQLRLYDGVGRYGGEEFLMILPNCDLRNTLQRANALRETIARTPVAGSGEKKLITMSMGVAVSACDRKNELETILNQADAGLYAAKAKGRNRVEHLLAPVGKSPASAATSTL